MFGGQRIKHGSRRKQRLYPIRHAGCAAKANPAAHAYYGLDRDKEAQISRYSSPWRNFSGHQDKG